ncbi:MAG: hypothetical protein OER43_11520 [Gammaproteobacteria bacterium]|nr:hypothetical protein [Gammaproteobacteria bacterium]
MKVRMAIAVAVLSLVTLSSTPLAYGADEGGVSLNKFQRYQSHQELELEREQAFHAELNAPQSREGERRQRQRFEAERIWQRQLLERQRKQVTAERGRSRPMPRLGPSTGIVLQRLQREQASERLSRELLR